MTWTVAASGVATKTGTSREFLYCGDSLPANFRLDVQCQTYTHRIAMMGPASPDGRTGWEMGIDPSDPTKVQIRRQHFAVPEAAVDTDTHNAAGGGPFTLRVERLNNSFTCSVIVAGQATVSVTHNNRTGESFEGLSAWGIVSSGFNGAVALSVTLYELVAVNAEVTEVAVFVGGGSVYAAYAEGQISMLDGGGSFFPSDADISMAVTDVGNVVAVGGGRAADIDVVARTCSDWAPEGGGNWTPASTGKLPGATEDPDNSGEFLPGTTDAVAVVAHKGRIILASDNELWMSAIGDYQMFWTDDPTYGNAVVIGVGRSAGVSHPILSLSSVAQAVLIIGQTRAISVMVGDPAEGAVEIRAAATDMGVSGLNSVVTGVDGINAVHSPDGGLVLVQVDKAPVPVSKPVLTTGIQFPRGDRADYAVTLVRDTRRGGTHIFLTKRAESGSVHLWYDERIGQYKPGRGGFFPMELPDAIGPTFALNWRGEVILGGKDGYLYQFDDTATDFDGEARNPSTVLNLLNVEGVTGDTILTWCRPELSDDSDGCTMELLGGSTAESVYTDNTVLFTREIEPSYPPLWSTHRAGALAFRLSSDDDSRWELEAIEVNIEQGAMLRRGRLTAGSAPGAPCRSPSAAADDEPGEGPGGLDPTTPQDPLFGIGQGVFISVPDDGIVSFFAGNESDPLGWQNPLEDAFGNDPFVLHPLGTKPSTFIAIGHGAEAEPPPPPPPPPDTPPNSARAPGGVKAF